MLSNGYAVLNAADEAVADLAQYSDGGVIFYAQDEHQARLAQHRVLSIQRPAVSRLLKTETLSQCDMLIAACAAWALDLSPELIRAGVKSYGQTHAV